MSNNVEPVDFPFAAARQITREEVAAAKLRLNAQGWNTPELAELFEIHPYSLNDDQTVGRSGLKRPV